MLPKIRPATAWFSSPLLASLLAVSSLSAVQTAQAQPPGAVPRVPEADPILQFTRPQLRAQLVETSSLLRAGQARTQFSVTGAGQTVAVMDTGLRVTHVDFAGKVRAVRNFTTDDGGSPEVVTDLNGHGTNVSGIATANGIHTGIAPGAGIVGLKVLANSGGGQFAWINNALDWVIANRVTHNITVVNMSLGSSSNDTVDTAFNLDSMTAKIRTLRQARVAVCIAAGNDYFGFGSQQGMSFPGIIRESVSVGALYDANIGPFFYGDGSGANTTAAGRFTPFSQRLHESVNTACRTDIFAPGAPVTSSGSSSDNGESTQHGTSQATPGVAGLIALGQQYHRTRTGQLPTVDQLEGWLRSSAVQRTDGDDEDDNVTNTGLRFPSADAVNFLTAIRTATEGPGGGGPTTSNITATFAAGRLTLVGTNLPEVVTVRRSGRNLVVTPGRGTRVNNTNSFTAYNVGNNTIELDASLAGGNDAISIQSLKFSTATVSLGGGNDSANLSFNSITTLNLDGGEGTDTAVMSSSRITTRNVTLVP